MTKRKQIDKKLPAPVLPEPGSLKDPHRLLKYIATIQDSPFDTALDEQREALWLAQSIVDTVAPALIKVFGDDGDWCAKYPEFPRVLAEASRLIAKVADDLESGILEDRALAIARAAEMAHAQA